MASQTFWEYAGYWSFAFVVICCAGEAAHAIALFSKESIHGRVGGKLWACLLVVALSAELATQVKTNSVSGQIIAFLAKQTAAAQDDTERLKNQNLILEKEVRGREILPAQERSVVAALKGKVREDVQIFTVRDPEAQIFSMNLAGLLQAVGMTGKFVVLPDPPPDQTGVMFCGDGSSHSNRIAPVHRCLILNMAILSPPSRALGWGVWGHYMQICIRRKCIFAYFFGGWMGPRKPAISRMRSKLLRLTELQRCTYSRP